VFWTIFSAMFDYCWEYDRTARIPHECCECKEQIPVGSPYHHTFGLVEGRSSYYNTCPSCREDWDEFIELLEDQEPDVCIIYSTLWEAIDWALNEELLTDEQPLVQKWLPRIAVRKEEEEMVRQKRLKELRSRCPLDAAGMERSK